MLYTARIFVSLKPSVNDPQGSTVRQGLIDMGFDEVMDVRVGKYIELTVESETEKFAEDKAIIGGLAKLNENSVMIIGTEKGNSMESRMKHNFGMAKPEGYRKVQRLFFLAEKFEMPIITLVDTAGAFPGKEAEERGQSESIASSIAQCLKVKTQIISIIIGAVSYTHLTLPTILLV